MKTKNLLAILLCGILAFSTLISCSNDKNKPDDTTPDDSSNIPDDLPDDDDHYPHTYGDWETVKEPTCTENGLKEMRCECGEKITEKIDALGHTEGNFTVVKEATKTENGLKNVFCSDCDAELGEAVIHATGSEGLAYSINTFDKTCSITGIGSCTDADVIIPAYIDDYKVTRFSLSSCSTIKSVKLLEGITKISDYAFSRCKNLENVVIPDSILEIDDSAFRQCEKLTEIVIPKNVIYIGSAVFLYTTSLESIVVDDENQSYKSVDGNLYTKDGKVLLQYSLGKAATAFNVPDGVTEIAEVAFSTAKNLISVNLPNGLEKISNEAFSGCNKLLQIAIPDTVESIGAYSFAFCSKLSSVTLSDNVIEIGKGAFKSCESLLSFDVPKKITYIDDDTFNGCIAMTEIDIPSGVTYIGSNAFFDCKKITTLTLPASLTVIAKNAFNFTKFSEIAVASDNPVFTSIDGSLYTKDGKTLVLYANGKSAKAFVIPDGVTVIDEGAFYGNNILESITIPSSVKNINSKAIFSCGSITEIVYNGTRAQWDSVTKASDWDSYAGDWDSATNKYLYTMIFTG